MLEKLVLAHRTAHFKPVMYFDRFNKERKENHPEDLQNLRANDVILIFTSQYRKGDTEPKVFQNWT